jgi:hypothetical protein
VGNFWRDELGFSSTASQLEMIMAIDKTTPHFGHRSFPRWLKTLAIALGLIVVGYVAVTMNDDRAPPLHEFAAAPVRGAGASAVNPTPLHGERLPTAEEVSVNPNDKIDSSKNEPRECRPDQGIVTDCALD